MLWVRNAGTWVAMSSMAILMLDGRLALLTVELAVSLFLLVFLGVGVAAAAQIYVWVAKVVRVVGEISTVSEIFIHNPLTHK